MLSPKQFNHQRRAAVDRMRQDRGLYLNAHRLIERADKYLWIHQTNWLGFPVLQLPQDLFALQEIIFQTRPDYVVETGVCWGGSLLFYASIMHILGGKKVIGIDINIPDHVRKKLRQFKHLSKRIELIEGSSLDPAVFERVQRIVGKSKRVMVHLDSNHTHVHALNELKTYSALVRKPFYLVCADTIVEKMKKPHRRRPWGPGNSPGSATAQFLKENQRFEVDPYFFEKMVVSCNQGGFLRCVSNSVKRMDA